MDQVTLVVVGATVVIASLFTGRRRRARLVAPNTGWLIAGEGDPG